MVGTRALSRLCGIRGEILSLADDNNENKHKNNKNNNDNNDNNENNGDKRRMGGKNIIKEHEDGSRD